MIPSSAKERFWVRYALVSTTVAPVWKDNTLLYLLSIVLGGVTGGVILTWNPVKPDTDQVAQRDTNYYRIRVSLQHVRLAPGDEPDPAMEADPET